MKQPNIKAAQALQAPYTLRVTWADGREAEVFLGDFIRSFKAYAPIRDEAVFCQVRVGEWGWRLEWPGDVDMGVDTVWRLAREQAGAAWPAAEFRAWLERRGLSMTRAADILGISRRTVAYYKSGEMEIPKTIRLACIGASLELAAESPLHNEARYPSIEKEIRLSFLQKNPKQMKNETGDEEWERFLDKCVAEAKAETIIRKEEIASEWMSIFALRETTLGDLLSGLAYVFRKSHITKNEPSQKIVITMPKSYVDKYDAVARETGETRSDIISSEAITASRCKALLNAIAEDIEKKDIGTR